MIRKCALIGRRITQDVGSASTLIITHNIIILSSHFVLQQLQTMAVCGLSQQGIAQLSRCTEAHVTYITRHLTLCLSDSELA